MLESILHKQQRSSSIFSFQNTPKYIMNRQKSRHMVNASVSNDIDVKQSYSILKLQMEDDGKVSISTNRRLIRTLSAKLINKDDSHSNSFVNTAQFFFHAPLRIPTPLHQITLKKQQKPLIVKLPEQRTPIRKTATSELIKQKILNAQRKVGVSTKYLSTKISIEPKVSYQKYFYQLTRLFSSKENLLKFQQNQNTIMFDNKCLQKIHSIRDNE